jgi:hypothetical protein
MEGIGRRIRSRPAGAKMQDPISKIKKKKRGMTQAVESLPGN